MQHRYEHEISKDHIAEMLSPYSPKTFVELGSHHGHDTKDFLSMLSKEDKLIGVEADPRSIDIIKAKINDPRFTLIHAAVTDKNGAGPFNLCTSECPEMLGTGPFGAASSLRLPTEMGWLEYNEVVEVPYITLNEIFKSNNNQIIDFIWCDVEGATGEVIAGGWRALTFTRFFYTEINETETYAGQMVYSDLVFTMMAHGFELVFKFKHDALFRNLYLTEPIEVE